MMWTLDLDAPPGGLAVRYPYFTGAEPGDRDGRPRRGLTLTGAVKG